MVQSTTDLEFPVCCAHCQYLERGSASCAHELRQSLIRELDTDAACPVYTETKNEAMRRLGESIESRER